MNPYNFPRGTLQWDDGRPPRPETVVNAISTGDPGLVEWMLGAPPIPAVVSGLRHAIVPARGHVFLSGDYAGIQARIVLALSGQHDKAQLMASGGDPYCDMASQIYGRTITKADNAERTIGKFSVLGLGFQMGWKRFKAQYGRHLSDEFCQDVVDVYRHQWAPEVPKLWRALGDASLRAVQTEQPQEAYGIQYRLEGKWLTARLPSGRKLWYFDPQLSSQAMRWDPQDIRPCWTFRAVKMGHMQTIYAFGGLLTENVVMGIEVDIQRHGWANAEREGFPIVMEVYDELVAEVPKGKADLEGFKQCLLNIPDWARGLQIPVAVECWSGTRYRKG